MDENYKRPIPLISLNLSALVLNALKTIQSQLHRFLFATFMVITPHLYAAPLEKIYTFPTGSAPFAGLVSGTGGEFLGTTSNGGISRHGSIFKISASGSYTFLHSFDHANGNSPFAGLARSLGGEFLGTTYNGGASDSGVVFKITSSGSYTVLHNFAYSTGKHPYAGLVRGSGDEFFGTTSAGGLFNYGTVYKITTSGSLTVLHSFNNSDGRSPYAALVVSGTGGEFLGTTRFGGAAGSGTVFKITASGSHTVLHNFNGANGRIPMSALVSGTGGDFFGTTVDGGESGNGTVFKINSSGIHTLLHSFDSINGEHPEAALVGLPSGEFLGTTREGGEPRHGTIFKITTTGSFTLLHRFNYSDGAYPSSALAEGTGGEFFGTTQEGGASGRGTIYKITATGSHAIVYNFCEEAPNELLAQPGLEFLGTSGEGGEFGAGKIFRISTSGSHTLLHSFNGANGSYCSAGLVSGTGGEFFGTTSRGGVADHGTVFKIAASGSLTLLHNFTFSNGRYPYSGLLSGAGGEFFGTTSEGGSSGSGTVYKITANGSHTLLHSFDLTNGSRPAAGLVRGPGDEYFGTTSEGGASSYGTVFKINASGSHTLILNFNISNGSTPDAGLVSGPDGEYFGTTSYGGASGYGTVFKITASGSHTLLHSFSGTNGRYPAGLASGPGGAFFGTTSYGGASGYGTIFKITASGSHTLLHSFTGSDGAYPAKTPVFGSDGNLYGTAGPVMWRMMASALPADAPLVSVRASSGITDNTATLNGFVNPCGVATTAQFEWGLSTSYSGTTVVTLSPGDGTVDQNVSTTLIGLLSATTYHYRLVATNTVGTTSTQDETFSTLPAPPLSTPVVRLTFDELSGTSAEDVTGNGWNGTLMNGTARAAGRINGAIDLDGVDDYVNLPNGIVNLLNDFTISAWVKPRSLDTSARVFNIGRIASPGNPIGPRSGGNSGGNTGSNTPLYMALSTCSSTGSPQFFIRTSSEQTIDSSVPLTTGTWTHLVVTLSGTVGKIYINGAQTGSSNIGIKPSQLGVTTLNYIGKSQFATDPALNGLIDDFQIFDHALTDAEIAQLATPPSAPTGLGGIAGDGQVALNWNAVSGANGYNIRRATSSGGPYLALSTGIASTSDTDFTSINGTTYYYVVSASQGLAESPWSTEISARPTAPISLQELQSPALIMSASNAQLTQENSVVGHLYQLQSCDNLITGPWVNEGPPQAGTGSLLQFSGTHAPGTPRRFYRVLITE